MNSYERLKPIMIDYVEIVNTRKKEKARKKLIETRRLLRAERKRINKHKRLSK